MVLFWCSWSQVAVKKMKRKFYFWEEHTKLRELKVGAVVILNDNALHIVHT